jgi:small GTP-binding protein
LWDTAGEERYRSLAPIYFRDAKAAVVVFDVNDPNPQASIEEWLNIYYSVNEKNSYVVVAANKLDLVTDRAALDGLIAKLKEHFELDFFVVSAKTGEGILQLFQQVAVKLVDRWVTLLSTPIYEEKEGKCVC